jgi:hypothetical protein
LPKPFGAFTPALNLSTTKVLQCACIQLAQPVAALRPAAPNPGSGKNSVKFPDQIRMPRTLHSLVLSRSAQACYGNGRSITERTNFWRRARPRPEADSPGWRWIIHAHSVLFLVDRGGGSVAQEARNANNSDRCNHIRCFAPIKQWHARRHLVRKLRDRSRHELRLLFVPTMSGNDLGQRRILPAKLCGTAAAAQSAVDIKLHLQSTVAEKAHNAPNSDRCNHIRRSAPVE